MAGIPGPMQGEAARGALTSDSATEARMDGAEDRARLDNEELQALERTEYYRGADPVSASPSTTDGFLKRLWNRIRGSG